MELQPCHVQRNDREGVARISDKGNIKVGILRCRSFETNDPPGKINIRKSVAANLRSGVCVCVCV